MSEKLSLQAKPPAPQTDAKKPREKKNRRVNNQANFLSTPALRDWAERKAIVHVRGSDSGAWVGTLDGADRYTVFLRDYIQPPGEEIKPLTMLFKHSLLEIREADAGETDRLKASKRMAKQS